MLTEDIVLGLDRWEEEIIFPESSEWLDWNKMKLNQQLQWPREPGPITVAFTDTFLGVRFLLINTVNSSKATLHMVFITCWALF